MSTFEWVLIALVFLGVVVPVWLFFVLVFSAVAKREKRQDASERYFAYVSLLENLHVGKGDFVIENGGIYAATIRELKKYPEFADLTVLVLEELTITGSKKFDGVMKNELQTTESHLLGQKS